MFSDNSVAYGARLADYVQRPGSTDTIADISAIGQIGAFETVLLAGPLGRANIASNRVIWENYIAAGGNVVIKLGTGQLGRPAGEAAAWNPLTTQFGLTGGTQQFAVGRFFDVPVVGGSFSDAVSTVRWRTGQEVAASGDAEIAVFGAFENTGFEGAGVIGLSSPLVAPVPLPAGVWLLGAGLAGLVALRRRTA